MWSRAVAAYLAHRRDEMEADDDRILRLAVRSEWEDNPPAEIRAWLDEHDAGA